MHDVVILFAFLGMIIIPAVFCSLPRLCVCEAEREVHEREERKCRDPQRRNQQFK